MARRTVDSHAQAPAERSLISVTSLESLQAEARAEVDTDCGIGQMRAGPPWGTSSGGLGPGWHERTLFGLELREKGLEVKFSQRDKGYSKRKHRGSGLLFSRAVSQNQMAKSLITFVVEHLDPELGPWSALEYKTIARESLNAGCTFILSSVPQSLLSSETLKAIPHAQVSARGVEGIFADQKSRVCLLDPTAKQELSPDDAEIFDVYLFGGILGDDPPRDRTSELRQKGYAGRRLGPKQMTTDTAVRVTRIVVQDKVSLDQIPYVDYPELRLTEHESTEMPFRYVKGVDGEPVMPNGMIELIKEDADKCFEDLEVIDERDS